MYDIPQAFQNLDLGHPTSESQSIERFFLFRTNVPGVFGQPILSSLGFCVLSYNQSNRRPSS
jgi:hypothetical protein